MSGSASANGLLFALATLFVLVWEVAGYYGADYHLLRYFGAHWRRPQRLKPIAAAIDKHSPLLSTTPALL